MKRWRGIIETIDAVLQCILIELGMSIIHIYISCVATIPYYDNRVKLKELLDN